MANEVKTGERTRILLQVYEAIVSHLALILLLRPGALAEYIDHYHRERNHQGKGDKLLFPAPSGPVQGCRRGTVQYEERLGGLLRYYEARAA